MSEASSAADASTAFTTFFLQRGPLKFVAVDIVGPLPKTKTSDKFIVVTTDRYLSLTRAIPTKKTTTTDVARIFVEN